MDCHNVQHDGNIGQKAVKDNIKDESRTKFCQFDDFGLELQYQFANCFLHRIQGRFSVQGDRENDIKDVSRG